MQKNAQNAAAANEAIGLLAAISVVAKRLAERLAALERTAGVAAGERAEPDGRA